MKALIVMKEEQCGWLREIIPDRHPGMMPLCNKPLLEYLLDFCILCGCDQLRLVMDCPDSDVEAYFGTGDRWGVAISYAAARNSDDLATSLKKNSRFCDTGQLLILEGYFFIRYHKDADYGFLCRVEEDGRELACPGGKMLCREEGLEPVPGQVLEESPELDLLQLQSIADIYAVSMEILSRKAGQYVLPGYNNEEGVHIGRNVAISKNTTINKPVMLGNNIQLQDNAVIGPGAIIGSNVIVDSGTCIESSIVLENSYVGAELKIKEKILRNDMAISAATGTVVRFVDEHLLSGIRRSAPRGVFRVIMHWCLAVIFYLTALLPALCCRLLLQLEGGWQRREETVLLRDGRPWTMKKVVLNNGSLLTKIARILAVDKVFQFPLVLSSKLDLVGNKPLPATPEGESLRNDFANYLPGVFFFSEAEGVEEGDFQEDITERFFSANRTLTGDLKVIVKTLLNRL